MTCKHCGIATRTTIWSDPLNSLACRACKDAADGHARGETVAMIADGIPGGLVVENYGPHPIRFDSHSERRAYLKAHGLQEKEKFCPAPGTDKDPAGIPNPKGYMDAQTMKNNIELLTRNGKAEEFDAVKSGVLRNLETRVVSEQEALRAVKE